MKQLIYFFYLTVFVALFASCSCQKQLQRLRIKCPECFTDTTVRDTFLISEYKTDTTFILSKDIDTFNIINDRVEVQIFKTFDTLKVFAKVPADTIIKEIKVPTVMPCNRKHLDDKTIEKYAKNQTAALFVGIFIGGLVVAGFSWVKKKIKL